MKQQVLAMALMAVLSSCATTVDSRGKDLHKAAEINADLGLEYLQQNQLAWAKRKIDKAVVQNPRSAKVQNAHAQLLAQIDQPRQAKAAFQRAIKLDPEQANYANTYGIFLCRENERIAAYQAFEQAAKNPLYKTPEFALDNAALCALRNGDLTVAQEYAMAALVENANFIAAKQHLAEILYKSGRPSSAWEYLEQSMREGRPSAEQLWLAVRISRALNRHHVAEAYAQDLRHRYPNARETAQLTGIQ